MKTIGYESDMESFVETEAKPVLIKASITSVEGSLMQILKDASSNEGSEVSRLLEVELAGLGCYIKKDDITAGIRTEVDRFRRAG